MKTLLVTSKVTFIPDNYNELIVRILSHPHIAGLLVLDNSEPKNIVQGLGFAALGARRTGLQLVRNQLFNQAEKRRAACKQLDKFYVELPTINCSEALNLVNVQKIDLILNARTRYIYKKEILSAPRLGCINIHHGLLPDQRGTMCDLWALSEGRTAGFTVHQMNTKIDDGAIIHCQEVSSKEQNFQSYLKKGTQKEYEVLCELLNSIAAADKISGSPNLKSDKKHFRNPTAGEVRAMIKKGMKL